MFVRKKKNSSRSISIQIISKKQGKYKLVETIGCSKDKFEIEELIKKAEYQLRDKRSKETLLKFASFPKIKTKFISIDELGYFKLDEIESNLFFQIVNKKYETSLIIINFIKLKEVFNDNEALTTAILDRLIHHSYIINIQGESYRLREKKRVGLLNFAHKTN